MDNFFERNKRKGLSALLVLFFRRGKGIGPILLLGGILSFIFIMPSDMRSNIPWLFRSDKESPSSDYGFISRTGGASGGLEDAMRAGRAKGLLGLSGLPGGENMSFYGKSTVNLVKGDEEAKGRKGREFYDGLTKDNQSVSGVLRPEDSKKIQDGVKLSDEEMQHGLTKNVYAGVMAGLPSTFWSSGGASGGSRFSNLFKAKASDRQADLLQASVKSADMPFNGVISFRGTDHSKMSWRQFNSISGRVAGNVHSIPGAKTNFYQLVETRAYSIAAAPNPGLCSPPGCPGEYASHTSASTFDGTKIGGNILTAQQLGDPAVPVTPSDSQVQPMLDQANQMEQAAKQCEQARALYEPQETSLSQQIQAKSNDLNGRNCKAGCGVDPVCTQDTNAIQQLCQQQNAVFAAHAAACPLMGAGTATQANCQ